MKEFIEKLIGRLEEQKEKYKEIRNNTHCIITETSECDSCRADHYLKARLKCIDRTIEIVNQLAEEYNNGWIPCSERLPKKDGYYLITTSDGEYDIREYGCSKGFGWDGFERVITWQPLPEPYQPKGE